MKIEFTLDGEAVSLSAHPCDRLSDILHDRLGRLSVRSGCQLGRCGSCVVLLDGRAVPSCMVSAFRVRGCSVLTFEGFMETPDWGDIEAGFREAGVETCGHCLAGKVLSAHCLIEGSSGPDRGRISLALSAVACRCTEMSILVRGVELAMERRRERRYGPQR